MDKMKRIIETILTICAWACLAFLVLLFQAFVRAPLWYLFLVAAFPLTFLIYRWKRQLWRPVAATLTVALLISYFAFEFVPYGNLSDKTVSGIIYKDMAGSYYQGDGLGSNSNLELTPDGRFFLTRSGCTGVYARNKGTVSVSEEGLILHPKKNNSRDRFWDTETVFIPVKWGSRIYLIPSQKMVEFCSRINAGTEPRERAQGRFYLRRQDWETPCSGWPDLGSRWSGYLLPDPVRGNITSLTDEQTGTLNLGSRQGLREGMRLNAQSEDNYFITIVEVVSVSKTKSVVKCLWKKNSIHLNQLVTSKLQVDKGAPNQSSEDSQ